MSCASYGLLLLHKQAFAPGSRDDAQTIEHTPSRKDSRGLHIRCPHCCNFVEVLTDTPYEEICCSTCGSNFSLVEREDVTRMAEPLKSIGRFDLVSRLGVGGFGTVWKARDRELDRTVAMKIPRRGQLSESEIDQFFREARAAAELRHTNIVPVHEVGRDGDTLFIVSDFIRGVTLTDWLTAHPVSSREIAELCIPIAEALHHAHQQGIVHRDFKPSNVMIDESGQPHLTDFGLAKREIGEITMTADGQILGTPAYMSPEQTRGGKGIGPTAGRTFTRSAWFFFSWRRVSCRFAGTPKCRFTSGFPKMLPTHESSIGIFREIYRPSSSSAWSANRVGALRNVVGGERRTEAVLARRADPGPPDIAADAARALGEAQAVGRGNRGARVLAGDWRSVRGDQYRKPAAAA